MHPVCDLWTPYKPNFLPKRISHWVSPDPSGNSAHNGFSRSLRLSTVSSSSSSYLSTLYLETTTYLLCPNLAPTSCKLTSPSDLLRRLNPKHTQRNLDYIIRLAPDLTEDLLSSVDQPLVVKRCKQSGRDYLLCDYNRDGDSYRSPWSNQFDPPLDEGGPGGIGAGGSEGAGEGAVPGERVRKMEIKANEAFDIYRELYYEGGVSSVYLWNLDDGFAGVVLLKKCESLSTHSHEETPDKRGEC